MRDLREALRSCAAVLPTMIDTAKDTWFLLLGTVGVGLALVGGCTIVGLLLEGITG